MSTIQTTLDRFGRILIPKPVRDAQGLEPGDALQVAESPEGILLRPVRTEALLRRQGRVLVFHGESEFPLGDPVKAHREKRIRKLSRG